MKKGTLILISGLAIALFTLAYCKESKKPLFHQEDGNYFVDNNFVINAVKEMSNDDVNQLIALENDSNYAKLTKGTCYLLTTARVTQLLRTNRLTTWNEIARLTRYDRISKILDINRGCFEVQQIDWAQFGDLKQKLDAILNKYNPALVNGNVSIVNNKIATSVVQLSDGHVDQLNKLTVAGVDEVDICADLMGPNKFTRILHTARSIKPNEDLKQKLNDILVTYQK